MLQQAEAGVPFHSDLRKWSHQCPKLALQRLAWPWAAISCSFPDLRKRERCKSEIPVEGI